MARRQDFLSLRQNNRTVTEYNAEFDRLARFCPELVVEDSSRMQQFIQGLDGHLQLRLVGLGIISYAEMLDRALIIESAQQRVFPDRKGSSRVRHLDRYSSLRLHHSRAGVVDQIRVHLGYHVNLRNQGSLLQDVSGLPSRAGNNPPATFVVSDVGPEIMSLQPVLWDIQFAFIANCLGTRAEIVRRGPSI